MIESPSLVEMEAEALRIRSMPEAFAFLKGRLQGDPRAGARKLIEKFEKRAARDQKERDRMERLWVHEAQATSLGHVRIAGLDEAGRGPLAGPVVASAVILRPEDRPSGLDDSKKLTPAKREELEKEIRNRALAVGVGSAEAAEIDEWNIYQAARKAMERAVEALDPRPDFLLTDAMPLPGLASIPQRPLIHGDALSASIAAASIVAKVVRDRLMMDLHDRYPAYGFRGHKGYGTPDHLAALREHGPCPEHRRSFAPVLEALSEKEEGGLLGFWSRKLDLAGNLQELQRTGHQLKRAASDKLVPAELEELRELFRRKRESFR